MNRIEGPSVGEAAKVITKAGFCGKRIYLDLFVLPIDKSHAEVLAETIRNLFGAGAINTIVITAGDTSYVVVSCSN